MGTIPKLNIRGGEGDVQALNRWADAVTTEFADQRSQVHSSNQKTTTVTNVVNNIIQNPSSIGIKGDGLVHGDAIWEIDPAYVSLRDDFVTGGTTDGTIGEMRWSVGGTNAGVTPFYAAGLGFGNMGEFGWANATTADAPAAIFPLVGNVGYYQQLWPLLENPGWKAIFIWRFHREVDNIGANVAPNFLKKSIYVGLAGMNASSSIIMSKSRPNIFIGARFDTDASDQGGNISDTTIHLEAVTNPIALTRNNTQGTVFDTGLVPAEDVYYRLEIQCIAAGVVTMSLNGSVPKTFTISQMTTTAGASSEVQGSTGQARFLVGTTFFGASGGSKFTIAGLTGVTAPLNGSYVNSVGDAAFQTFAALSAASVTATAVTGWTLTGYPALIPFFSLGNSFAASLVTDLRIMAAFFSFVQNPGVGGGTGAPDPTKSRFF